MKSSYEVIIIDEIKTKNKQVKQHVRRCPGSYSQLRGYHISKECLNPKIGNIFDTQVEEHGTSETDS